MPSYAPGHFAAEIRRALAGAAENRRLHRLQGLALAARLHVLAGAIDKASARDALMQAARALGLVARYRDAVVHDVVTMGLRGRRVLAAPAVAGAAATGAAQSGADQLDVRRMSEVESRKTEWLWPNRIAIGRQTLIGGEPGLGKSQLTAAFAAAVTTGGDWPCGEGRAARGSVVILSAEDDAADTIRPRLDAAGADVSRVYLVAAVRRRDGKGRRVFNLQADLPLLEQTIAAIGDARLVIIDPVSSYMGKTDSHKNADVRGTLEPLGDMASRLRVAVVSITHFSKGGGNSALNSFIGSIAFIAAARSAFIVTRDPESEDPARRLFITAKNNLARDSGGLAFRIEQQLLEGDILASAIVWDHARISRTADEVLAAVRDKKSGSASRTEAENFLRDLLASGPLPAKDVEAEAKNAGLAWRTVRRAQHALGIKPQRRNEVGGERGKSGRWNWTLPTAAGAD